MLINTKNYLQVDSITFDWFGKACPNYSGKFAMFLLYFKKEDVNEVNDLELAGSNTALTIYFTSNILPPLALFFSHFGIHTKPFLHLITFLCKITHCCFKLGWFQSSWFVWIVTVRLSEILSQVFSVCLQCLPYRKEKNILKVFVI